MNRAFRNRREAGEILAEALSSLAGAPDLVVLGLPRGGIPVAFPVAQQLSAPLDVFVVRKLGLPDQPELAFGAIASGNLRVLNREVIAVARLSDATIERITEAESAELRRRERLYRGDHPVPEVRDHTVILVDDGLATGATMRAAIQALRERSPARLVVAVPVGAPETCARIRSMVDELVCVLLPEDFQSVGDWYDDFSQTSDAEVRDLLARAKVFA